MKKTCTKIAQKLVKICIKSNQNIVLQLFIIYSILSSMICNCCKIIIKYLYKNILCYRKFLAINCSNFLELSTKFNHNNIFDNLKKKSKKKELEAQF